MESTQFKPYAGPHGHAHSKRSQLIRWASLCATLCVVLTLSACASLGGGTPEEQVRQRATERWQALVKGEFSRAYGYSTPSFRAVVAADGYRNRFGAAVTWTGAEVLRVNCPEASKCVADLRIDFKTALSRMKGGTMSTGVEETWLFEDGQWWFFQRI